MSLKKRLVDAVFVTVAVVAVVLLLAQWFHAQKIAAENARLWRTLAEKDSVIELHAGVLAKLSTDGVRLGIENAELKRALDELKARERHLTKVVASLKSVKVQGAAVETVYVDTSGQRVHEVRFDAYRAGVHVRGWTRTPPPTYRIFIDRKPIPISVLVAQNARGDWYSFVKSPDSTVEFQMPVTISYPYRPSFAERIRLFAAVGTVASDYLAGILGIRYGSFMIGAQMSTYGRGFFVGKEFRLWKKDGWGIK